MTSPIVSGGDASLVELRGAQLADLLNYHLVKLVEGNATSPLSVELLDVDNAPLDPDLQGAVAGVAQQCLRRDSWEMTWKYVGAAFEQPPHLLINIYQPVPYRHTRLLSLRLGIKGEVNSGWLGMGVGLLVLLPMAQLVTRLTNADVTSLLILFLGGGILMLAGYMLAKELPYRILATQVCCLLPQHWQVKFAGSKVVFTNQAGGTVLQASRNAVAVGAGWIGLSADMWAMVRRCDDDMPLTRLQEEAIGKDERDESE